MWRASIALVAFAGSACGGQALEQQVRTLRASLSKLRRQQAATQVRYESLANRLLVLEDGLSGSERSERGKTRKPAHAKGSSGPISKAARARASVSPSPSPVSQDDPLSSLPVLKLRPGVSATSAGGAVARSGDPKSTYKRGLSAFRAGRWREALRVFRQVTAGHAKHSLADNALYWSARARKRLRDIAGAISTYEMLLRRYPKGNKVPDALVGLAELLQSTGKRARARTLLARVVHRFPASSAARKASIRLRETR